MFHLHHDMFQSVHDLLGSSEYYVPLGDHSTLQKSWYSEHAWHLDTLCQQAPIHAHHKKRAYRVLDLMTDAYSLFLKEALNPQWQRMSLEDRKAFVAAIKELPQIPQRSREWYEHFATVLTASEFATLFASQRQRAALVQAKAFPPPPDQTPLRPTAVPTEMLTPTGWGIRFEPVVKQILEYKDGSVIYEPGRITHRHHGKLAASPDGVIEKSPHKHQIGRLVEIKCVWTRTIGGETPLDYWIQMQIQMEVVDGDECEYVEVEIVSARPGLSVPVDLSGCSLRGLIAVAQDTNGEYKYVYGKIGDTENPVVPDGWTTVEIVPWGFRKWHRKIVQRDRAWFQATLPWQEAFWADVERVRCGEPMAVPVEPIKPRTKRCLITDDSSASGGEKAKEAGQGLVPAAEDSVEPASETHDATYRTAGSEETPT